MTDILALGLAFALWVFAIAWFMVLPTAGLLWMMGWLQ
jgi:hypothetical protein